MFLASLARESIYVSVVVGALASAVTGSTAGAVVKFSHSGGIREVGFFIDEAGNHFWGTFPHRLKKSQGAPLLLFSDRDRGLYILRYGEDG
jgi:hypothetical protein